jgi:predicted ATP-grasp superfamily ATP-dependent carboligase
MIADCTTGFRVTHLGIVIAGENPGTIIGMPTSEVYSDPELLQVPKNHLDNGIQAQLYVGHDDTLVVYYPHLTPNLVERISENLLANASIWKHLTGISIRPKELVIAYETSEIGNDFSKGPITLKKGSLLSSSIEKMEQSGQSILGFVSSSSFLRELKRKIPASSRLDKLAEQTDILMDKNHTMAFLGCAGTNVPKTYTFERTSFSVADLDRLDEGEYIVKPAGGAAGIGLFPKAGTGASPSILREHLRDLISSGTLPGRFQIQEFIEGLVWGVMGLFFPGGRWQILQIHTQQMDKQGRFIGGRWNRYLESERLKFAEALFSSLADLDSFEYQGVIEFDLIGEKIIEVNPRITASSPICHLLSLESKLQQQRGKEFHIDQIDINTQVQFPEDSEKLTQIARMILKIHEDTEVLVLPQGISPIGKSRVLFVNDDEESSSQFRFLNELDRL